MPTATVKAAEAAAQAYLSLGTQNIWRRRAGLLDMIAAKSFATGGWGPDEHFGIMTGAPQLSLGRPEQEFRKAAGAYAHFKITPLLLRVTRESTIRDSMEERRIDKHAARRDARSRPDRPRGYIRLCTRRAKKTFTRPLACCSGKVPMMPPICHQYLLHRFARHLSQFYVTAQVHE